ncbi:hypothetical protein [Olsenella massiliensis]|uniref:hypothetical protein n=1 Tax=Olsenella massiliensis TaxID=1622075 RepID=UPI00071D48F6|nr:hypothetical protein [Olsenella massiliensis]
MAKKSVFSPADLADMFGAGRRAEQDRMRSVNVTIMAPASGGDASLTQAVRSAFVPQLVTSSVTVRSLSAHPDPASFDADWCVILPDPSGTTAEAAARAAASAMVAACVVVESSLEERDLGLAPELEGLVTYVVASDPARALDEIASWALAARPEKAVAFAANFSFARARAVEAIVARCARENALVGTVAIIPGADLPVMTLNQAKMALEIAAACGEELRIASVADLAGVLGAGFAYRALARALVGAIPGIGRAVKGGVGYLGTQATGRAVARRAPPVVVPFSGARRLRAVGDEARASRPLC